MTSNPAPGPKATFTLFSLLLLISSPLAWSDLGGGVCSCTSCSDCTSALNNVGTCTAEVRLTTSIGTSGPTCINDPSGFNNKIFDCQGYTINGNGYDTNYGIDLWYQGGNTIRNCVITDYSDAVHIVSGGGNNILANNSVYGNYDGIYLYETGDNNTIANNTITDNYYTGILHTGGGTSESFNDRILNNTLNRNNNGGISLGRLSNCSIIGNRVDENSFGLFIAQGNDSLVANNSISNNTYAGIQIQDNRHVFVGNIIESNGPEGILMAGSANSSFINNRITNHSSHGIYLANTHDNYLDGNNITDNYYGVYVDGSYSPGYSYNNTIVRNNIRGNFYGLYLERYGNNNTITGNNASNNSMCGFCLVTESNNNTLRDNYATGNGYHGFWIYQSDYNNLTSNLAENNVGSDGFNIADGSEYNLLVNNTATNPVSGYANNNGFFISGSFNTLLNNTANNNQERGFWVNYGNYNVFDGNNASNDPGLYIQQWGGFILASAHYNGFYNNTANGNSLFGFSLESSSVNAIVDNVAEENGMYDLDMRNTFSEEYCNNVIEDLHGSGGRPVNYTTGTVAWDGITASEIVLCDADGSQVANAVVRGSDTLHNNGLVLVLSDDAEVSSSLSEGNFIGFLDIRGRNNTIYGNTARNNSGAGNTGGGFLSDIDTQSTFTANEAYNNTWGFSFYQSNSTFEGNLAHDNMAGFYSRFLMHPGLRLVNNTVHSNGYGLLFPNGRSPSFDTLTASNGDMSIERMVFYDNGQDFEFGHFFAENFNFTAEGLLFLNPAGTYENYTNLSLGYRLSGSVPMPYYYGYRIFWVPLPGGLPTASFGNKSVEITNTGAPYLNFAPYNVTPGIPLDSISWGWTDAELTASGADETTLDIYENDGTAWAAMGAQLDAVSNTLSIAGFEPSSVYSIGPLPEEDGGEESPGGECSDDSGCAECEECVASHCMRVSGCEYACTYDFQCPDDETCQNGDCIPVACGCGDISNHTCNAFECCADAECQPGFRCLWHSCAEVFECTADTGCAASQYCDILLGKGGGRCKDISGCGTIANHRLVPWECGDAIGCPACLEGKACGEGHTCVDLPKEAGLSCPSTGLVGENKTCAAKTGQDACPGCDYVITDPAGKKYSGKTGDDGSFALPLSINGTYRVSLMEDGQPVRTVEIRAMPVSQPSDESPPVVSSGPDPGFLLFLLVLLLIGIVAVLYWRRRGGKREKPKGAGAGAASGK
jgi:parallel beta-helix repeat protein